MLFVHGNNIDKKITENYKGLSAEIENFKENYYLPMKNTMMSFVFSDNYDVFESAAAVINNYRTVLHEFAEENHIDSRSKFESTFLEELNVYLFHGLDQVQDGNGVYDIYNKGIYKDLKITENLNLIITRKDVDFCIGKNVYLNLGDVSEQIIVPTVCVEVKTYLDVTMLNEATTSSKMIRHANPDAYTYVLAGYRNLKDEHLLVAEREAAFDDIFFLQRDKNSSIDPRVLYVWWKEIHDVLENVRDRIDYQVPGRVFKYVDALRQFLVEHPLEGDNE